jgi:acyltransferase
MTKREEWIDNLKGLGIIIIVFGHSCYSSDSMVIKYIYTFHVPLFFFISGYLFKQKREMSTWEYIRSRFKRLIIPYVCFNIIAYLTYGIVSKKMHFNLTGIEIFAKNLVIGNYVGSGKQESNLINISTWFLPCLFFTGFYYYLIDKYIKRGNVKLLMICVISALIFLESKFFHIRLPLGMDIAFMGLFFYGLGNIFKPELTNFVDKVNFKYLLLVPVLITANILFFMNETNMSTHD